MRPDWSIGVSNWSCDNQAPPQYGLWSKFHSVLKFLFNEQTTCTVYAFRSPWNYQYWFNSIYIQYTFVCLALDILSHMYTTTQFDLQSVCWITNPVGSSSSMQYVEGKFFWFLINQSYLYDYNHGYVSLIISVWMLTTHHVSNLFFCQSLLLFRKLWLIKCLTALALLTPYWIIGSMVIHGL